MEFSLSLRATGRDGGCKESGKNEKDKNTDQTWDCTTHENLNHDEPQLFDQLHFLFWPLKHRKKSFL